MIPCVVLILRHNKAVNLKANIPSERMSVIGDNPRALKLHTPDKIQ